MLSTAATRGRKRLGRVELEARRFGHHEAVGGEVERVRGERRPDVAAHEDRPHLVPRSSSPVSAVVVVLPLVPVMAMRSASIDPPASSSSPMMGTPRARAAARARAARAARPGSPRPARRPRTRRRGDRRPRARSRALELARLGASASRAPESEASTRPPSGGSGGPRPRRSGRGRPRPPCARRATGGRPGRASRTAHEDPRWHAASRRVASCRHAVT